MSDETFSRGHSLVDRVLTRVRTPLLANAYALIFSSFGTSALGFVYWALAARYYTPENVGLNSAAIAALLFFTGVSALFLDGALIRFIPRAGQHSSRLIWSAYLISASVAVLVGALVLLGIDRWSPELAFLKRNAWWATGFVASVVLSTLFLIQDGALTGLRQTIWVPVENGFYALIKIGLLLLFARYFPDYGIFLSWVLPIGLLLLPVNWLIFRRFLPRHTRQNKELALPLNAKQVAHYAGGLYVGFLFSLTASKLLPVIVLGYVGSVASAYFYLPWMFSSVLQLITPSMTTSLTVEGSREPEQLARYSRRVLREAAQLVIPAALVIFVGAPFILRIFGPDYAAEGSNLLRLLALAAIPHIVNGLYIGISRVQRRVARVVAVQASVLILLLGLSHLLLPRLGIVGVGWAWLSSQLTVATVLILTWLRGVLQRRPRRKAGADLAGAVAKLQNGQFPRRIHILGGPGIGKSTLAQKLGKLLDIPVYELDRLAFAGEEFEERPLAEREANIEVILRRREWITEGIFLDWTDRLVEQSDLVIWLDHIPWHIAMYRIVHRFFSLAWQDARQQRHLHEFLRFDDYGRHLRQLVGVFFSSRTYYSENGEQDSRAATEERLAAFPDKVIHCRTPEGVNALMARAEASRERRRV